MLWNLWNAYPNHDILISTSASSLKISICTTTWSSRLTWQSVRLRWLAMEWTKTNTVRNSLQIDITRTSCLHGYSKLIDFTILQWQCTIQVTSQTVKKSKAQKILLQRKYMKHNKIHENRPFLNSLNCQYHLKEMLKHSRLPAQPSIATFEWDKKWYQLQ